MSWVTAAIRSASEASGSSSTHPVERAGEVTRVRVDVLHPRARPLGQRGHRDQDRISTTPVEPFTRIRSPVLMRSPAFVVPTTAGMPNSRATTAGVRDGAARLGHEPRDLGEEDDPRGVGHPAHEDVALLDLVELVERGDVARRALDHAGRRREALDLAGRRRLARVELVREAPERRCRGRRAPPRSRCRSTTAGAARRRPRARRGGPRRARGRRTPLVGHQQPQLVVVEEDDVLGVVDRARLDELAPDRERHEPEPRVRALVDVEVVVRRERVHAQRRGRAPAGASRVPRPRRPP